jgi:hypothetical protein
MKELSFFSFYLSVKNDKFGLNLQLFPIKLFFGRFSVVGYFWKFFSFEDFGLFAFQLTAFGSNCGNLNYIPFIFLY